MSALSQLLLRQVLDGNYTTKRSTLTFTELDNNLKLLADCIREVSGGAISGILPYDNGTEYSANNGLSSFVTFNNNTYEYINPTPQTGITPGTDPSTWQITTAGLFSHAQNTDTGTDANAFAIGDGTDGNKEITFQLGTKTARIFFRNSDNALVFDFNGTETILNEGTAGGGGTTFLEWTFDGASQTDSDPGQGFFRLNNTDPTAASFLYIDNEIDDGTDVSSILSAITVGSRIALQQTTNPAKNALYEVMSSPVDGTGYWKIEVSYLSSPAAVTFDDTEKVIFAIFESANVSGTDVRETLRFDPDLGTVVERTYIMPSQLVDIPGNSISSVTYRAALNDGNFNYTSYASLAGLNAFLAGLSDGTQVRVERTAAMVSPDDLLVINNIN